LFTVKARPVVYYDRYTSTTVALYQVNLLSQVQGFITGIFSRKEVMLKREINYMRLTDGSMKATIMQPLTI